MSQTRLHKSLAAPLRGAARELGWSLSLMMWFERVAGSQQFRFATTQRALVSVAPKNDRTAFTAVLFQAWIVEHLVQSPVNLAWIALNVCLMLELVVRREPTAAAAATWQSYEESAIAYCTRAKR